ncbi:sugar transporter STL1 [Myriangium duriaei CBS 260.36]|uniref:Sugar transporter STL1 n=1 Tax=Myriangium duriaei CBS 260.36 TaxID=1168546 RepID=A0A9P4J802_9PEZI|nr:sugar transporter STL1 [Myriangium duriaei CBS 260.36]
MTLLRGRALLSTVSALTCCTFLLIGYDNGVMGGVIGQPAFKSTFNSPGATIVGLIVSLYEVGCFLGAITTSIVGERLGRRWSLFIGAVIMLIGAIIQAASYSRAGIIVARIISGVGMGFLNSTAPVYQSEFSPKSSRGIYACAQLSTLNFGIFLSYWIGYAFAGKGGSYAWRIPVIIQCAFIIPIGILSLVLPESPRWLMSHERVEQARTIIAALYSDRSEAEIDDFTNRIHSAVVLENSTQIHGLKAIFQEDDIRSRKRLLIACSVQFFQQLGGINGFIYYSGTIFSQALGFDDHMAALMSGFLFTWFFVASFIPWFLIERIGRRPLLLVSVSLMAAIFAVLTGLIKQIQEKTSIQHSAGAGAAAMLFLYMGCFTTGFQATVWVYPPEILSLKLRQRGTALATSANWIINFMVVQVTPVGITNIGWKYYIIYAVFNACFVPIMYLYYPETRGLELEEVDRLFATESARRILDVEDEKGGAEHFEVENEKIA